MSDKKQPRLAARSMVLGTAGHIDHGKTSLVLALTGTDADRLPEEKARGITIDLGFASLNLTASDGTSIHVSIIDVPGHHAFIRNMLAGTGGIDCVVLVIAANEGVKPQTVEHLAICNLLGIRRGLIALSKCDLVSSEHLRGVHESVERLVENTFLANAPILPVSSQTGEGVSALKEAIAAIAVSVDATSQDYIVRLPIDRAFALRGFGTIVTGTLQSGAITNRDALELQPGGRAVRVRGLQTHGHSVDAAQGPTRVALNLSGVEVGELKRGQTLVPSHSLSVTRIVDVELEPLPGLSLPSHRSQVRVHAFASETMATLLHYDDFATKSGAKLARLRLRDPLLLVPGDRFILRRTSPAATICGGRVLDVLPLPRLRKPEALQWLEAYRNASPGEQLLARVDRRAMSGIRTSELVAETGLTHRALQSLVQPLAESKKLITGGSMTDFSRLLSTASVDTFTQRLIADVTRRDVSGMTRAELSSRFRLEPWVADIAWSRLAAEHRKSVSGEGIQAGSGSVSRSSSGPDLDHVEQLYRAAGLAAPILSEAAAALHVQPKDLIPLTTQLLRAGRLLRLGKDDLLLHAEALQILRSRLSHHQGELFDVGRFKDFTGLSRKHAIPLLELLDRMRATRNTNGVRTVL